MGYNLLIFVYEKKDDGVTETTSLVIKEVIFVHREQTADSQTTKGLLGILERDGTQEDIVAFLEERNLILHEEGMEALARRIMDNPPEQGYLTISNALQWRLQFGHAIRHAKVGDAQGVESLLA